MRKSDYRKKLAVIAASLAIMMGVATTGLTVRAENISDYPGMQIATNADGNEATGSITVTVGTDENDNNYTINAYQVLKLVTVEGQTVSSMTNSGKNVYIVNDNFDIFFSKIKTDYTGTVKAAETIYLTYDAPNSNLRITATKPTGTANEDYIQINNKTSKLDSKYMAASLIAKIASSNSVADEVKASSARLFSDWLNLYINARGFAPNAGAAKAPDDPNATSVTISDLNYGYYVVRAVEGTNDNAGKVINSGILNVTDATGITLKSSPITANKSVENASLSTASTVDLDGDDEADCITATIGDTLTYTVDSKIISLTSYDLSGYDTSSYDYSLTADKLPNVTKVDGTNANFAYCFADTMGGQKLDITSVKVTIGAKEFKVIGDYLVPSTAEAVLDDNKVARITNGEYSATNKSNYFAINFNLKYIKDNNLDTSEVKIEYSAELMGEAANESTNTATFTYSNDPYDATGTQTSTVTDENHVYTYDLKVDKAFSDGDTSHYGDVKFKLYTTVDCAADNVISFAGADGVYTKADSDDAVKVSELALAADGTLKLHGLGEGTYYLKEQEDTNLENAGYNVADVVTIYVTAKNGADVLDADATDTLKLIEPKTADTAAVKTTSSVYLDGVSLDWEQIGTGADANKYGMEFTVLNQKGFSLPVTGENGNRLFAILGIILVLGGGTVVILTNRKKKDEA